MKRLKQMFFPSLFHHEEAPLNTLRILAFADLHYWTLEEIKKAAALEYDLCVLLGDIPTAAIAQIADAAGNKPIFAVQGNHDTWEIFNELPVLDLHKKTVIFRDVRFAGFGGSVRYKKGPYAMYTLKECISMLRSVPSADILLSHDCMHGLFEKEGVHSGLKGITKYIKRNKVKLNICGHHHQPCMKVKHGCTTVCVFRCAIITYPGIKVQQVF